MCVSNHALIPLVHPYLAWTVLSLYCVSGIAPRIRSNPSNSCSQSAPFIGPKVIFYLSPTSTYIGISVHPYPDHALYMFLYLFHSSLIKINNIVRSSVPLDIYNAYYSMIPFIHTNYINLLYYWTHAMG